MELLNEETLNEVQNETEEETERKTAIKWAERSAASFTLSAEAKDMNQKIYWFVRGYDTYRECIEHSAQCGDQGQLLNELEEELQKYRQLAIDSMKLD